MFAAPDVVVRHRLRVVGVVQGVGFRPFVHRLARELALAGHVGNDVEGVFVEVEGAGGNVEAFETRLFEEAPPLAKIYGIDALVLPVQGDEEFRIVASPSTGSPAARTYVSPDIAACDDCLDELFDPADRRYRYPFLNCTNCGPRFTITMRLPYDRPNTTMRAFELCSRCRAEYDNEGDRRFHAQPIACAACGPRLWFEPVDAPRDPRLGERPDDTVEGSDAAIAATQHALARGAIVAIKGIGGFHLACDAGSDAAVEQLRERKHRADKPFAIMVADLESARALALVDEREADLLTSPQRPIVLLRRRCEQGGLSALVAPGNPLVGILLPYAPLQHLLFRAVPGWDSPVPRALVMTSGNLSDEPICYEDAGARERLGSIVDAWLTHDRPIHVPCDDSVVRVENDTELPIRRSRGYAPLPVRLPFPVDPLLAVGGELKNAFCMATGRDAWMSQHIGDMGSLETLAAFARSIGQFGRMYGVRAEILSADAHPGYQTRRWAEDYDGARLALVQHHHAHIAALMAENAIEREARVIGVAFDGTGYGTDGAIWGGEILLAGYDDFERSAHLSYVPLPGGDAAVRKPYRVALSHLRAAGIRWDRDLWPVQFASPGELAVVEGQLARNLGCVPTSSMGRLFDAVSSLLGVRQVVSYEAQAAIELETLATRHLDDAPDYSFDCSRGLIHPAPVLRAMASDLRRGESPGRIAAGFHYAVARMIADSAERLRRESGVERVALSGGVFQNVLLVALTRRELHERRLEVLTHRLVPPNDGGLALGQAVIAASRASEADSGKVGTTWQ